MKTHALWACLFILPSFFPAHTGSTCFFYFHMLAAMLRTTRVSLAGRVGVVAPLSKPGVVQARRSIAAAAAAAAEEEAERVAVVQGASRGESWKRKRRSTRSHDRLMKWRPGPAGVAATREKERHNRARPSHARPGAPSPQNLRPLQEVEA